MWTAVAVLMIFLIGFLLGLMWAARMFRAAHLNIADSLAATRKILSRGDINNTFEALESLELMVRRWEIQDAYIEK